MMLLLRALFLFSLVLLAACGGSKSDDQRLDDPTESETPTEPEKSASIITLDNHVGIVANVFAIFSGKLYGDELLTAPDYSDPAYQSWPEIDGNTAELISQPADIVCSNGGTLVVIPETTGFHSDNVLTWHFDFDNCQDGLVLFDGKLSTSIYESIGITATGFVRDNQTKVVRFSGTLGGRSGGDDLSFWNTNGAEFTRENSDSSLVIKDLNTSFHTGDKLAGGFTVQANWTDSKTMTVRVLGDLAPGKDAGKLELTFDSSNVLVMDGDTGDVDTVDVTVTADGTTSTVTQSWALWSDSLIFKSVSGL